jgi:hypothetical protein
MNDIKSSIKVSLDDCLLYTKTEDYLLAALNLFFKKCQEHGVMLHASKCVLFATMVRCCGRSTTQDGVHFDPKNMEALQKMQERRRLCSVCRGSKLDAKRHSQLRKACDPFSSSTVESVRG